MIIYDTMNSQAVDLQRLYYSDYRQWI